MGKYGFIHKIHSSGRIGVTLSTGKELSYTEKGILLVEAPLPSRAAGWDESVAARDHFFAADDGEEDAPRSTNSTYNAGRYLGAQRNHRTGVTPEEIQELGRWVRDLQLVVQRYEERTTNLIGDVVGRLENIEQRISVDRTVSTTDSTALIEDEDSMMNHEH